MSGNSAKVREKARNWRNVGTLCSQRCLIVKPWQYAGNETCGVINIQSQLMFRRILTCLLKRDQKLNVHLFNILSAMMQKSHWLKSVCYFVRLLHVNSTGRSLRLLIFLFRRVFGDEIACYSFSRGVRFTTNLITNLGVILKTLVKLRKILGCFVNQALSP